MNIWTEKNSGIESMSRNRPNYIWEFSIWKKQQAKSMEKKMYNYKNKQFGLK